jgi:hypothetical protein
MRAPFVLLAFALASCTTSIKSVKVEKTTQDIASGVLYSLPATAVEASLSFVPTSCKLVDKKIFFSYDIADAEVKHKFVPDADQQHAFDYTKLNSKMKISSAHIEMHSSGMFKSINTSVDDRSTEVMGAVAGITLNLVKASIGLPGVGVSDKGTDEACPVVIKRTFDNLGKLRAALPAAKRNDKDLQEVFNNVDKAKAAVESAKVKLSAAPDDSKLKKDLDDKVLVLTNLAGAIKDKELEAPALQEKIAKTLKILTARAQVNFVPTITKTCESPKLSYVSYFRQFAESVGTPEERAELANLQNLMGIIDQPFTAAVCVTTAAGSVRTTPQSKLPPPEGILYRLPVLAQVSIAQSKGMPNEFTGERWISVPQFGTIAALSLTNGPFDKNSLKVTFAEDGALSSLEFAVQAAAAERGMLAAQNISKTYLDIVGLREKAKLDKEKAADEKIKYEHTQEIAMYDAQISILDKKRALDLAKAGGKGPVQQQIDATQLETDLIKKKIELEKQRRELEKLTAEAS